MLLFCPVCSNSLIVSRTPGDDEKPEGQNRMECRTCPYQFLINGSIFERKKMQRKVVDDVLGGKEAWANADRIETPCHREGCHATEAFYYQVQIRSADEPMTTFYRCTECAHSWREN